MTTWVWVDGEVLPAAEGARVAATDRGLLLGDGVYETCKVAAGVPFALTRHLARLRRSAERIGLDLPWGDSVVRSACAKAVGAALVDPEVVDDQVLRLRITVTGGAGPLGPVRVDSVPSLTVAVSPARAVPPTASVAVVTARRDELSPSAGAKTISRLDDVLALAEAHERGADEAVLVNTAGFLCEGTGSNLFLVLGGRVVTPSLGTGCLPGVTRELVCELSPVDERDDLRLPDLAEADEVFLTSSTREVHPVGAIDGRILDGAPGPVTAGVVQVFAALKATSIDP